MVDKLKDDITAPEVANAGNDDDARITVITLMTGFRDRVVSDADINIETILEKLESPETTLTPDELALLISLKDPEKLKRLYEMARKKREFLYGRDVFLRAVIEISNYCRRTCKFCGNTASNRTLPRYRADFTDVFNQAKIAKSLGIDLIHLASGEDMGLEKDSLTEAVRRINEELGCTVELAVGSRPLEDYQEFHEAGARRSILKFETTNLDIFNEMKPHEKLGERLLLLLRLRNIGFKIGTGNIIGLPGQEPKDIAHDLLATTHLSPDMASTSIFTPNKDSVLREYPKGNEQMGLNYIALLKILMGEKRISIPTNSTLGKDGKYQALELGALELSLNMTPGSEEKKYSLYDGRERVKVGLDELQGNIRKHGFTIKSFSEMFL
ncbi:MAG: radical SAM protein [Candidatus Magasanikbacteria bacterium]|nr:radical SAM protein [Candidatus Magasanikbacteria bacterium]